MDGWMHNKQARWFDKRCHTFMSPDFLPATYHFLLTHRKLGRERRCARKLGSCELPGLLAHNICRCARKSASVYTTGIWRNLRITDLGVFKTVQLQVKLIGPFLCILYGFNRFLSCQFQST